MQKTIEHLHTNNKIYCKAKALNRDAAHIICNLKYSMSKEIPVVFHTGLNYDYHFIIKELAKELE